MRQIGILLALCAIGNAQTVSPGRVISGGYYNNGLWHQVVQPGETITLYRTMCSPVPDKITFSVSALEYGGQPITVSLLTYSGTLIWSQAMTLEPFTLRGTLVPNLIGAALHRPHMTLPDGLVDGNGRFRADIRNDSAGTIELLMVDGPNCHYVSGISGYNTTGAAVVPGP